MTLADRIKELGHESYAAFAEAHGLDKGQLSKWLATEREGHGQLPDAVNISKLSTAAGETFGAHYWAAFAVPRRNAKRRKTRQARTA